MEGIKDFWERVKESPKTPTKEAIIPGSMLAGMLILTFLFFHTLPVKQTLNSAVSQLPDLGLVTVKYIGRMGNRGLSMLIKYDKRLSQEDFSDQLSSR